MSSIQNAPVEILLDVFQPNDPAGTEALQLTCRRFNFTILQNLDTLPTRLVCDLVYCAGRVYLYRATYTSSDERSTSHSGYPIADANESPTELQDMYRKTGRKIAIRTVAVWIRADLPDASLMHLIQHFPSVNGAVRLDIISLSSVLPTDAALHHFERLETVVMDPWYLYKKSSFWSDLFALKAIRRVPNFIATNSMRDYPAEVGDGALFGFIRDFSLMPADKPRVLSLGPFNDASLSALKRRFYKNIASIRGQVCAVIWDHDNNEHYLTNMASGSQKKTLAKQLLRDAYGVPAVSRT